MKKILAFLVIALTSVLLFATTVKTQKDDNGWRLLVDNQPLAIKGVVWSYTPIGNTFSYNLWDQTDLVIRSTIDTDMTMLKAAGVNAIRVFSNVPPKWIEYIYTKYGIYTMVNDLLGRYGVSVNGQWYPQTDYSDVHTRKVLIEQAKADATKYKDVKGVLLYMFGNESNYGLSWAGTEIEDLPAGDRNAVAAGYLYSLLEEAMKACKEIDSNHPVGFVNGDVQYMELIKKLCPSIDILGVNAYRGYRFYDTFYSYIADQLDVPVIFTEEGADAYNALTDKEDQYSQMLYLREQWHEIYQQAYGKHKTGNIIGSFVFEWMDEWWKRFQNKDLLIHNTVASWSNAGYELDYQDGKNNMDEEWFGIVAQSPDTLDGINKRVPRAAYYMLQEIWKLPLYESTKIEVEEAFSNLDMGEYLAKGNAQTIKDDINDIKSVVITKMSTDVESMTQYNSETASNLTDDDNWTDALNTDYWASSTLGVTIKPFENFTASTSVKFVTGADMTNIADDNASYVYDAGDGDDDDDDDDVVQFADIYDASFTYNNKAFDLIGFYHTGHGSFYDTGDIFYISADAWSVDEYASWDSKAPIGVEYDAKGLLSGLKIVAGPEIYDGADPQYIVNYYNTFNVISLPITVGGVFNQGFAEEEDSSYFPYSSYGSGIKGSLDISTTLSPWVDFEFAGLTAGSEKIGAEYTTDEGDSATITEVDTLGAYAHIGTHMFQHTNLYVNGIYRGLVSDTNSATVYGDFFSDDSGSGNRTEVQAGADFGYGAWDFKSIFRYRKPLEDAASRSLVDGSPFAVSKANREAAEIESVLTFDTEGATWFHEWNIEDLEGAPIAGCLSGKYTFFTGETDKLAFKSADSWSSDYSSYIWYAYDGLEDQTGLWQAKAKVVANPNSEWRLVGILEAGCQDSNGSTDYGTTTTYWGVTAKARYNHFIGSATCYFDYWGPEEWYQTFGYTYPAQWTVDLAYGFTKPLFSTSSNRIGIKWQGLTFGEDSGDLAADLFDSSDIDGFSYSEVSLYFRMDI
jgi:hypothetical protein